LRERRERGQKPNRYEQSLSRLGTALQEGAAHKKKSSRIEAFFSGGEKNQQLIIEKKKRKKRIRFRMLVVCAEGGGENEGSRVRKKRESGSDCRKGRCLYCDLYRGGGEKETFDCHVPYEGAKARE